METEDGMEEKDIEAGETEKRRIGIDGDCEWHGGKGVRDE